MFFNNFAINLEEDKVITTTINPMIRSYTKIISINTDGEILLRKNSSDDKWHIPGEYSDEPCYSYNHSNYHTILSKDSGYDPDTKEPCYKKYNIIIRRQKRTEFITDHKEQWFDLVSIPSYITFPESVRKLVSKMLR